jgi:hypothetical protein
MKRTSYNPTALERCTAAAEYDNAHRSHFDPELTPSDYTADGATVTLNGGATYWVVTHPEAREVGILFDETETVYVDGRKWVVTLA